jgi:hypothetical protein
MSEPIPAATWQPPLKQADCVGELPARADVAIVGAGFTDSPALTTCCNNTP